MMRGRAVLAAILVLATSAGLASAAPAETTTAGSCEFTVNTGLAGAGNQCRSVTVRTHDKSGHVHLRLNYDGATMVEVQGPAIRPSPGWTMVTVRRLAWINPGDDAVQVLLDREDGHDEVSGRCAIAWREGGAAVATVQCALRSDFGEIKIEFDASGAAR